MKPKKAGCGEAGAEPRLMAPVALPGSCLGPAQLQAPVKRQGSAGIHHSSNIGEYGRELEKQCLEQQEYWGVGGG